MILSVIIVSYNTSELTLQTIKSCLTEINDSNLLKSKTEIIVVDNNSSDASIKTIKQLLSTIHIPLSLIQNKNNNGFAKANNQGIKKATGKYILLLNSDTIVRPHALERLVKAMDKFEDDETTAYLSSYHGQLDRLGILAASLLNPDGSSQPQGGSFPNLISLSSHMLLLDDIPIIGKWLPSTQHTGRRNPKSLPRQQAGEIRNPKQARKAKVSNLKNSDLKFVSSFDIRASNLICKSWVAATAMLVKREVFDEIGLLDENIFMYGEDVEFCLRANQHLWDIAIHPNAQIVHYGSASSSSKNAIIGELKGYQYIWSKHKPLWQLPILKLILKTGISLRVLLFATIARNREKLNIYQEAARQL